MLVGTSIAFPSPGRILHLHSADNPIANPHVALREEFDDWAVIFNPDADFGFAAFGLNPTGVCVWKLIHDGEHAIDELADEIGRFFEGVPEESRDHIRTFVDALVRKGLAAYGNARFYDARNSSFRLGVSSGSAPLSYEQPKLIDLGSGEAARGSCGNHGSQVGVSCSTGNAAAACCGYGSCGAAYGGVCCSGTCGGPTCGNGTSACDSYCYTGTGNSSNCGYGSGPYYQCLNGSATGNGQCRCGTGGGCSNGFSVC